MKKRILVFALLCLAMVLSAQKTIQTIDISYDNPIVTRVVLTLSDKAEWTYSLNKEAHQVKAIIYNTDAGNPVITGLNKNFLVTNLDMINSQGNALVNISVDGTFLIEKSTFTNPNRIVIDLFQYKRNYTYQDRLNIANFYNKVGKLDDAGKEFGKMAREFPQNLEVYYHWGQLLLKQNKPELAREKFSAVPQGSSYFQAAQNSLAKLDGNTPVYPEAATGVKSPADSIVQPPPADTVVVSPVKPNFVRNTFNFFNIKNYIDIDYATKGISKLFSKIGQISIWFWIIIFVVILVVILVAFDLVRFRKQKIEKSPHRRIKADNITKQNMVNKLLVDGWKEHEIARELLMSEKEARLYIKQGKKLEIKRNKG
jgi:tetratricopeptide (TPR) repeat protein